MKTWAKSVFHYYNTRKLFVLFFFWYHEVTESMQGEAVGAVNEGQAGRKAFELCVARRLTAGKRTAVTLTWHCGAHQQRSAYENVHAHWHVCVCVCAYCHCTANSGSLGGWKQPPSIHSHTHTYGHQSQVTAVPIIGAGVCWHTVKCPSPSKNAFSFS